MNITKPEAKPAGGGKPKKAKKKEPAASSAATPSGSSAASAATRASTAMPAAATPSGSTGSSSKKSVPFTDDEKGSGPSTAGMAAVMDMDEETVSGPSIESPFRYANLCADCWPKETLTFSMPFDDALLMGEALTMVLRRLMADQAPSDSADLIGRIHWGGEDALGQVIDACSGKKDPLHQGRS